MTTVPRNDALLKTIRPAVQFRNEPNFAWGQAGGFALFSQVRAFWPISSVNEAGNVYDTSGQGRTLTNTNAVTFGLQTLIPYSAFVGASSQRLTRADEAGLDITSDIFTGCWVYFTNAAAADEYIIAKWAPIAGGRSYALLRRSTGVLRFQVSVDGAATTSVDSTTVLVASTWYYAWGMADVAGSRNIYCGIDTAWWTAAGVAAIFNGTASFDIGASSAAANFLTGRVALPVLCAATQTDVVTPAISRGQIRNAYEQTRANYGK